MKTTSILKTPCRCTPPTSPQNLKYLPLGLPKGTVRSLITLCTVGSYLIAMFFQMFMALPVPETMSSMVITVIAFYFGVRSTEDMQLRSKK